MTTFAAAEALPAVSDFDYVRDLVRRGSAIILDANKEYLVEARLAPLARREGFATLHELIARLRADTEGELHRKVVEAMTTNETLFFRDAHSYEALRTLLRTELVARRATSKQLRIWSAACSTGQEPYTIAMLLRDSLADLASWRIDIVATDLSSAVLARARSGKYGQIEVNRGLSEPLLARYFDRSGIDWQIKDDIRRMVDFRELNLAAPWPPLAPFDVIFLRNVLIYFDADTKRSILGRIRRLLRSDGYLFLGAAETTMHLDEAYERVQVGKSGCYRVKPGQHSQL